MNRINKVFIFSGGKGKRLGLFKRNNIKAFTKVNSKKLLIRHIENINKYLDVKKIYIIITENEYFFKDQLKQFLNVEVINNKKDYTFKGIIGGLKLIKKYINESEKFLILLSDEYYDSEDFQKFCDLSNQINYDEVLIAIKEFKFPQEYFKNYSVSIDQENNLIVDTVEKNKKIVSKYFGTGLMCLNNELFQILENNNDKISFYSLIKNFNKPKYFKFQKDYININTKVDIYDLQKKIIKIQKLK